MDYISTRGNYKPVSVAEAIQLGMVPDGGLFVPETIPQLSEKEICQMQEKSYQEIAIQVLNKYLTDFNENELVDIINSAYNDKTFNHDNIAPVIKLDNGFYILELWHGPTAAFKDMALQLMPYLLVKSIEKLNIKKKIVILVATSGDTGKAALEGFKDISGIQIIVFYPDEGVSMIQERQMLTTDGNNTSVVAVKGNFDDCQNSVKEVFADKDFNNKLKDAGYQFSSANSINWGRLVPQIIYYFAAYIDLLEAGEINCGDKINIVVPTGNFGNILAGYYAYRMGLPVNKFLCASNDNKILTDFLETGIYDINRDFKKTISPSMDILISSNLERFLFEITDHDHEKINQWYEDLSNKGRFEIDKLTRKKIKQVFSGEFATGEETKTTIKNIFDDYQYTLDPHTAVGVNAFYKYEENSEGDIEYPSIIDATASPFKFGRAVLDALQQDISEKDGFQVLDILKKLTDEEIHRGLKNLDKKEIKHQSKCTTNEIREKIKDILEL